MFLIRLACSFSIALLLMGCQTTVAWREEVKLNSGEVIVIDRESDHRGGGGPWPFGQGTVPKNYRISFEYPPGSGNIIRWHSTKFDMPRASWPEMPLVLDKDINSDWYIYTIQGLDGGNCLRYVKYQYQHHRWTEKPLSDEPIEEHDANLYLGAAGNDIDDYLSRSTKAYEYYQTGYRNYYKQVGPKQIIPWGDGIECRWMPAAQTVKSIILNQERK